MGIFDDGSFVNGLINLVRSPRVTHLANAGKQVIPNIGGPLSSKRPVNFGSLGNKTAGAAPKIGQALNGMITSLGGLSNQLAQQQQPQQDPLVALYNQLVGNLQQPVNMPTGIDTADLMAQVRGAIDPIYDQRIQAAEDLNARGQKDIHGMYGALADDYERLAPEQQAQAAQAQQDISQLYGQLRSNITGDYARVSNEQGELFKRLGIEDALPTVLDQQDDAVNEALVAANENQAQQKQRYMDQGNIDETFYREGSPIATMTGNELGSDLIFQLNQYVNQANAERTAGIQSAYMDQLGQAQNNLLQQQQMAQSESARRQDMLFQLLNSQMQGTKQQELTPDSFMAGLDPGSQQAIAGAYTKLQRSPEMIYGKVEDPRNPVPGSFVETTPEWQYAQIDAMLQRGEITPQQHQLLLMYAQLMAQ